MRWRPKEQPLGTRRAQRAKGCWRDGERSMARLSTRACQSCRRTTCFKAPLGVQASACCPISLSPSILLGLFWQLPARGPVWIFLEDVDGGRSTYAGGRAKRVPEGGLHSERCLRGRGGGEEEGVLGEKRRARCSSQLGARRTDGGAGGAGGGSRLRARTGLSRSVRPHNRTQRSNGLLSSRRLWAQ